MRITIFEKKGQICYSTSQIQKGLSPREDLLLARGWRFAGNFYGRDMASPNIRTMNVVLRNEEGG